MVRLTVHSLDETKCGDLKQRPSDFDPCTKLLMVLEVGTVNSCSMDRFYLLGASLHVRHH